ncbi:hypothetical protein Peur_060006 [Populus x canadensis]
MPWSELHIIPYRSFFGHPRSVSWRWLSFVKNKYFLSLSLSLAHSSSLTLFHQIPRNSMEAPSKLAGGQAAQPSAAETKKAMKRWMKDTERQFKRLKADCAEFVKRSETSSKEMLDRLQNNLEQAREAKRLEEQKVEQQKLMINTLQQLLPFEMTEFGTGATGLPVHHPPEAPAIEESLGLLQSHLPQGLAHGSNVEQPDLTYDGDLPVSLSHLNNTDPSRTAMVSGSSPMQGSLAPQGQGNNSEQPASANDDQFPDVHSSN